MYFSLWTIFGLAVYLLLNSACNTPEEKGDRQTNQFVVRYNEIYSDYGNIPFDSSLIAVNQFLIDYPMDAKSWLLKGRLFYSLNETDSALACYKKAISIQSNVSMGYSFIANHFAHQGLKDSAFFYFDKAFAQGDSTSLTRLTYWLAQTCFQIPTDTYSLKKIRHSSSDSTISVFIRKSYLLHLIGDQEGMNSAFSTAIQLGFRDTIAFRELQFHKMTVDSFFRLTRL